MNCLIVGYGNIGKIHTKYLDKNKIAWKWYDPFAKGPESLKADISEVKDFDRVMICSSENKHYECYRQIRDLGYEGYIFIEKPAAINLQEVEQILSDNRTIIGMVERFNPAIVALKAAIDVDKLINIDFSRCCVSNRSSGVSILEDIGIHDIDLLFFLLEADRISECSLINRNKTTVLTATDPLVRMIWSKETFFKERKIIVRQIDCTYEVDLQEQLVIVHWESKGDHVTKSLYVEKSSPIENEHRNFFSDIPDRIDCLSAHKLLLELNERQSYD